MAQCTEVPAHPADKRAREPAGEPTRRTPWQRSGRPPGRTARALVLLGSAFLALVAGTPASAEPAAEQTAEPAAEQAYPLDALPREVPARGAMRCPKVELVDHRGDAVRFHPHARVFSGFRDRLAKLERVVQEVGIEVYGRAPQRIVNLGTYNCRRMAAYPEWLSEHGVGNAIDVSGFDFGPLPKGAALPAGLPRVFKNAFEVRVQTHWRTKVGHAAVHSRFLQTLARRLIARKDVFRVLLGPGYPNHQDHFHFDMAPYRLVQIFDDGKLLLGDPGPRSP